MTAQARVGRTTCAVARSRVDRGPGRSPCPLIDGIASEAVRPPGDAAPVQAERERLVHFRPRPTLGAYFRQYRSYARGDGKADLWRRRHAARYLAYGLAPIVLLGGVWYKRLWLAGAVLGGAYMVTPYRRLGPWLSTLGRFERVEALAWVPVIRQNIFLHALQPIAALSFAAFVFVWSIPIEQSRPRGRQDISVLE